MVHRLTAKSDHDLRIPHNLQPLDRGKCGRREPLRLDFRMSGGRCGDNSDGWETGTGPLRFVNSHPTAIKLRQGWVTPTLVSVRRGAGAKGDTPLTARDEIEFPSLASLRILKEFIKRRVAPLLAVLICLQAATSSLLASVVDSDGSSCILDHARRLYAFIQMQNTFAGIKPYCAVCIPITQTMRLLTHETTRPVHIFFPTRIVATTVRRQDR